MTRVPFAILVATGVLIVAFQNFSHVPREQKSPLPESIPPSQVGQIPQSTFHPQRLRHHIEQIHSQSRSSADDVEYDIREFAPKFHGSFANPSPFATGQISSHAALPERSDLKAVGQQLLEQELRPTLRPLETEWVGRVNRYLAGFVPVDGEDWPDAGGSEQNGDDSDRAPAGQPSLPGLPPGFPGLPGSSGGEGEDQGDSGAFSWKTYRPRDIRLTKANEISLGFAHQTRLSCEVGSAGSKIRVSRPLSSTSSIDFNHETQDSRNSVGFKLSW